MFQFKTHLVFCAFLFSLGMMACGESENSQLNVQPPSPPLERNQVMMQYFHWYLPADGSLWQKVASEAATLSARGITSLWLPPATKAIGGAGDVGYGSYDLYDLGEFDQKGSVRTKYGTKDQYLEAINKSHQAGLSVYADIVMNHRVGADTFERAELLQVNQNNRYEDQGKPFQAEIYTVFNFPGRANKYSNFSWRSRHFDGVDTLADNRNVQGVFRILGPGKGWDREVSAELGNYDYLIGADLDMDHPEVQDELKNWGQWYLNFTRVDGFRLDAVKHIKASFFDLWLKHLRQSTGRELFTVGEYWDYDVRILKEYLSTRTEALSLFDAPLHLNFFQAARAQGGYDMTKIFDRTLVKELPQQAVTLVENHDTQPLQALESPVEDWFKPLAYGLILLREDGLPSVFYPDYYGATYTDRDRNGQTRTVTITSQKAVLDRLLALRRDLAYGTQRDYFDDPDVIAWSREGTVVHPHGLAVIMSDRGEGSKLMELGSQHSGRCFRDLFNHFPDCVRIDAKGFGVFKTKGRQISVWTDEKYGASAP